MISSKRFLLLKIQNYYFLKYGIKLVSLEKG